jgi:hypothetical protein
MSHGNDMIGQPVTLSGYAEWPQVADAVIAADNLLESGQAFLLKGNAMAPAILPLHYCSVHHLLFSPALQVWLSCTPVQIEHTFGEALRLTESTCPRCTTMTQEMLHKQFPKLYPYSEKPAALRGTEGCKLE